MTSIKAYVGTEGSYEYSVATLFVRTVPDLPSSVSISQFALLFR